MPRSVDPFERMDPTDDARFYAIERKVTHIEPGAMGALRAVYQATLPAGGEVLDLMSSWRSHLPPGLGAVTGLGMNEAEMADNPQLDRHLVHDLNRNPRLPFPDTSFDAAVCAVSVQYLTRPIEVFAEVRRVLRSGAPFVVSFSNRCFPTKAVAVWLSSASADHVALVRAYFETAGFATVTDERPLSSDDPLWVVTGRT